MNAAAGAMMREARERKRWTQIQLAKAAGCSQERISKMERGLANPSAALVDRVEDALDLTRGSLRDRPEDPSLLRFLDVMRDELNVTDEEVARLRSIPWKAAGQHANLSAWSNLLRALRDLDGL